MAFGRQKKKYMEDDEIIVIDNVTKSYQAGVPALSDVNIRIKKGEFVFIVGDRQIHSYQASFTGTDTYFGRYLCAQLQS